MRRRPLRVRCLWTGNPSATGAFRAGGRVQGSPCRATDRLFLRVSSIPTGAVHLDGKPVRYGVHSASAGEHCSPLQLRLLITCFADCRGAGAGGCGSFRRTSEARPYVLLLPDACFAGRRGRRPLQLLLPIACCLLPIAYCLNTFHFPLSTVHCPLSTSH